MLQPIHSFGSAAFPFSTFSRCGNQQPTGAFAAVRHIWSELKCVYCETCDPECLVQCLGCDQYFCNRRSATIASHIVHHLYRSRHNSIKLVVRNRVDPRLWDLSTCFTCPPKSYRRAQETVFTLGVTQRGIQCKTCAHNFRLIYTPLIKNHAIIKYVLPNTPKEVASNSSKQDLDIHTIVERDVQQRSSKANGKWREKPKSLLLTYDSPKEYYCILSPLLEREAAHSYNSRRTLSGEISIQNRDANNITFLMPSAKGAGDKLRVGDPVRLTLVKNIESEAAYGDTELDGISRDTTKLVGQVLSVDSGGRSPVVKVQIRNRDKAPGVELPLIKAPHKSSTAVIHVNWNDSAYRRKQMALKSFALGKDCMSNEIRRFILGRGVDGWEPDVPQYPSLSEEWVFGTPVQLDSTQREAVDWAMRRKVSIIQGPPGTGKTRTLTALVWRLMIAEASEKILVCAPSNAAVNHLMDSFEEVGIQAVKVAKMGSFTKPADYDDTAVRGARVICATCIGSNSRILDTIEEFPIVVIDEATQATEAETLVPLVRNCRKLVLVGDHKQLGPVVVDNKAKAADLGYSMFERFVDLGVPSRLLQVQYRMHPSIWKAPAEVFYEHPIKSWTGAENSFRHDVNFPWPRENHPIMFLDVPGSEEKSPDEQSWINREEANKTMSCISKLVSSNVDPDDIGVISFYSGQVDLIRNPERKGKRHAVPTVWASTVDSFQGQEKAFIIVSCVRGNSVNGIGFVKEKTRVNVALTRAKCGLIIIGNASKLESHPPWNELIAYWRKEGYICDQSRI